MLRAVFLLLVLLNLLALAWGNGLLGDRNPDREPQRSAAQFAADKIHIVPASELASATALRSCHAFAGLAAVEAQQIKATWTEKMPVATVTVRPAPQPASYDIAITGLPSTAADAKLTELKQLGFNDGPHIVAENDKRCSIVIASFAARAAADEAMKNMIKKGLHSGTVVARPAVPDRVVIEVRGGESDTQKLSELAAALKNATPAACATP